jgi:hypothetical protein
MRSSRLLLLSAILLLAGSMFAGLASAFWSAPGTGTASGAVATLNPPTGVAASASASDGTVHVTWTPGTAPNGSANNGFYVQRFVGATPSPGCATSPASLTTGAACEDTSVADGIYTYKVTAVFGSWTAQSVASVPVTVARLHHLTVSAPASASAGAPFTVAVTAKDGSGTTINGYLGTVGFTSTDSQATLPTNYTFVPADGGSHSFVNGVTLRTSGSAAVTVNDTVQTAATGTVAVSVMQAAPSKLSFAQQPTGTTAGAVIIPAVTVRIEDDFGNLTTSTASASLAVTGGAATLNGTTTRTGVAGVSTFADLSVNTAGTYTLVATSPGLTGASSLSFAIRAAAPSKLCVVATLPTCSGATLAVANGSTTTTQIRIFDQYGNVATATGAVSITLGKEGQVGDPSPLTVTIGPGGSTSGSFSVTINSGKDRTGYVGATATGLTLGWFALQSP